jgi:phage N-6-adenine-methyltransferase
MTVIEARYGKFDLDVAATAATAKAPRFFTKENDARPQVWCGENVWMNPPYGRGIGVWTMSAVHEVRCERASRVVALLPANTSAHWFAIAAACAREVLFLTGRVSFLLDGVPQKGNTGGSVIMVFERGPAVPWSIWDWQNP